MTKLYTLFATPGQTADLVMIAPLRIIEEYLGAQVPRTFAAGEVAFTIDHDAHGSDRHHRVGHWLVAEGAVGFSVSHTQASYLDRFPADARIWCDRAYEDGYCDGYCDGVDSDANHPQPGGKRVKQTEA